MAVSKRLRYEILRRDNHTCRYCGGTAPDVELVVDHVVPTALGGSDEPANLAAACRDCNSGKSATPPGAPLVADVAQSAIRWRHAMEFAADELGLDRKLRDAYRIDFESYWSNWTYESNGERKTLPLPTDWRQSIDAMVKAGLSTDELEDAVQECMYRARVDDRWRYFCGIAWNVVRAKTATALAFAEYSEQQQESVLVERVHLGWPFSSGRVL